MAKIEAQEKGLKEDSNKYIDNVKEKEVIQLISDRNIGRTYFKYAAIIVLSLTCSGIMGLKLYQDKVASELKGLNVPVVSPIGTNLTLYDNVFQSRPSDDLLKSKIINYVKADSLPKNIVIISDTKNSQVANEIKHEFNSARMVFSRKNKGNRW